MTPGAAAARAITADDARSRIPPRAASSRKGQNGKVLVVGGGTRYHGAPVISSMAALRAGCDLVYTAVPPHHATAARSHSPCLIVIPLADQKLTRGAARKLLGAVPAGIDSAAIGMGLAVAEAGALELLVSSLVDADVRLVLDAGALSAQVLPAIAGKNCVLTPHAGEYARLFGAAPPDDVAGRAADVEARAREHSVAILLKGQTDVVSDGSETLLCEKRAPAMTVGGTGDVLSGVAASLLARTRSALGAAAAAAHVNAAAGERLQARLGSHIIATDLVDELPAVMAPLDTYS
ncbi:MAG: NAD(P)H-hydrate dehydratase [Thaumarchaeota archaeon]|nr:NAD(P)H-hydrate dehydratase [Nitrososphaerota archaeon]